MIPVTFKRFAGILFLVYPFVTFSGDYPLEVRFSLIKQNTFAEEFSKNYSSYRTQEVLDGLEPDDRFYNLTGSYGLEGTFGYKLNERFRLILSLGYDYQYLLQDDVLDKWNWSYWEETYIEFIPRLSVEEVNRSLSYNALNDSSRYAALFSPQQRLKELRLATGVELVQPLIDKFKLVFRYDAGVSFYTRELRMYETWYKRYNVGTDSARFDYSFDLLHFGPPKRGMKFFIAPSLGLRYALNRVFDFEFSYRFIGYTNTLDRGKLRESFPLYSKYQLSAGFVIKY